MQSVKRRATGLMVGVRFPARAIDFSLFNSAQNSFLGESTSPLYYFPRGKASDK
jgi:hypothetical protein